MNIYENIKQSAKEIEASFAEIKDGENKSMLRISRYIALLRGEMNKSNPSHVDMQDLISKIGVEMPAFAMQVANASTESEVGEFERKKKFREVFLKHRMSGMTISEAQERARKEAEEYKMAEIKAYDKKLRLKFLWESIQIMITTIQTRLGMVKTEMMMHNQK